jgi:hypothetical protein
MTNTTPRAAAQRRVSVARSGLDRLAADALGDPPTIGRADIAFDPARRMPCR